MPTAEAIKSSLTGIANEWQALAIAWHVAAGALILAIVAGWRPASRAIGRLLVAPLVTVSALAWLSGNPFNGAMFAALALVLVIASRRLPALPIHVSSGVPLAAGLLLIAFGWTYPHFLEASSWTPYAYAAPLGLVPCPTLAALIGGTLALGLFTAKGWSASLAIAGLLYGAIGVFRLDVPLDYPLLAGAALLAAAPYFFVIDTVKAVPAPQPV